MAAANDRRQTLKKALAEREASMEGDQLKERLTGDPDMLKQIEAFSATVAKGAETIAKVAAKLAPPVAAPVI
jgi:hypothetical protein